MRDLPHPSSRLPAHQAEARRRSAVLPAALAAFGVLLATGSGWADDPDNCLLCHQYRGLSRLEEPGGRLHLYFVDPSYSQSHRGPHARLACTACHPREQVAVVPHQSVTPVDCARQCHLADRAGLERLFSHDSIPPMLQRSAHALDVMSRLKFEGGPLLADGQAVCLYCHDEPVFRDPAAVIPRYQLLEGHVFDRCDTCHIEKIDVDTRYYVQHIASRFQPARPTLELVQVCAVCHSDPRVLADHGMKDAVASFVRSFHGKAALLGEERTADCLSCHVRRGENAHLMLAPADPHSSVNAANVAESCRSVTCHPGADKRIADAAVHLDLPTAHGTVEFALALTFIVLTLFTFGPSALLVLLDLVQVILGRRHHGDERLHRLAKRVVRDPRGPRRLQRFDVHHRVQHWILALLFVTLVLTGFPLKFAERPWAAWLVQSFGGLGNARLIHHWSGIALVVGFFAHMGHVLYGFVLRARELRGPDGRPAYRRAWVLLPMWISPEDVRKTFRLLAYLLLLRRDRPTFGRFSPTEKFEYLGVFWGTALLGLTGLLLWGEQISSHLLSGRVFNIATIAHTYEAFLAVIHVGILHIYNVILAPKVFPLSTATLDGRTPLAKLAEEHGELVEEAASDLGIDAEREESSNE